MIMKSSFLLCGLLLVGSVSAFIITPHHHGAAISPGTLLHSVKARGKYKKKIAEEQEEKKKAVKEKEDLYAAPKEKFLLDSLKTFDKEEFDVARKLPEPPATEANRLVVNKREVADDQTLLSEVITNQLCGEYILQCATDSYHWFYLIHLVTMLQGAT